MPTQRQAYVPQPVVDRPAADLRTYIEGRDAVSQRPFMQEVIEALSNPLNDNDIKGMSFERETPRLLAPDTEDNLQQLFIDNNWTDFLPVTLPTEARVDAMLKGTSRQPDEVVCTLAPAAFRERWELTVEKIAVNAVMAGARPDYLPVILALAATGVTARASSTNSFATISLVNGPIRGEIGMNDGIGVMGPFNHANATIGRAYSLLSQNGQGGSVPNDTYMGTVGNWLNYSCTLAEAEERSPWAPFHVTKGYEAGTSTASVFFGGWYIQAGYGPRETWAEKMRRCLAASEQNQAPLILMDPIAARGFAELGFDTKEKLQKWCAENARLPAREYWDDQWIKTLKYPLAAAGVEPHASRLKAGPDEQVSMWEPGEINIIVAGGETQGAWKMIGGDYRGGTVPVDEWR